MKNGDIVGSDKIPQSEAEQSSLCRHQRPGSSGEWWLERRQSDREILSQEGGEKEEKEGEEGWGEMDSLRAANS